MCGKDGHLRKDCHLNKKGGAVNAMEESQQPESEAEIFGVLTTTCLKSTLESTAVMAKQPVGSCDAVVGSMDSVRSSSGMHGCLEWLVDSGATSHILAERNLQFFEVVKEYEGVVDLKAANGEKILVNKVVDLAVYMACFPGNDEQWIISKRKSQRVVLTHVIVASIDFNVLSPYVLAKHGWELSLSSGHKSCLRFRNLKFALEIYDRGWWFVCEETLQYGEKKQTSSPMSRRKRNPDAMEVDQLLQPPQPVKRILKQQGSVKPLTPESGNPPAAAVRASGTNQFDVSTVRTTQLESTGLTYLLRVCEDSEVSGSQVTCGNLELFSCHTCQNQTCQQTEAETDVFHGHEGCSLFESFSETVWPEKTFGNLFESCLELGFARESLEFYGVAATDFQGNLTGNPPESDVFHECVPWSDMTEGCSEDVTVSVSAGKVDEWLFENGQPTGDMEDHPLPPLDHQFSEDEGHAEASEDLELADIPLYEHLSQGHEPYIASCHACARSKGRVPARRVKHERSPFEVAMDITFLGPLKILVMVVLTTSMYGAFQMFGDLEKDARTFNNWMRELGLTGKRLELTLDGERRLETLVRTSMRLDNCVVSGVTFKPTPPNRSQSNGKCERFHGILKRSFAANMLFMENQIEKRIPLESHICRYLLPYCARTYNLFHVASGSFTTAMEKLRGRSGGKKIKTYPFGCTIVAKPTVSSRSHELEELAHVAYLGPVNCHGGGFWGALTGPSKVGLVAEEQSKVRKFQVARVVSPLTWDIQHLVNSDQKGEDQLPLEGEPPKLVPVGNEEVFIPPSGPPKAWIEENGTTPGCIACKQWEEKGTTHFRVHSRKCKDRCKEFLELELKQKRMKQTGQQQLEPPPFDERGKRPLPPPYGPENPHPTGGKRYHSKSKPSLVSPPPQGSQPIEPDVSLGEVPKDDEMGIPGDDDMSDGYSTGTPVPDSMDVDDDMDIPPPVPEPMSVDFLVGRMIDYDRDKFLAFEQPFMNGQWFQTEVCGVEVWQQCPQFPKCENTGKSLEVPHVMDAIRREFKQLSDLKVGEGISEKEMAQRSKDLKVKVIPCRWVFTLKDTGVTRARLVCKDFKHLGQSALREGHYSPTSTIESLRSVLAVGEMLVKRSCPDTMVVMTLDVSTAFMYAKLRPGERVLVSLPSSTQHLKLGGRFGLDLYKAMNGLRKAPLLWYLEMKGTLLECGCSETSDASIFRKIDSRGHLMLILLYVDDTIVFGDEKACEELLQELSTRYEIKKTGCLHGLKPGRITFLGRSIVRNDAGELMMGVGDAYFDEIEAASGLSLKTSEKVPDLGKFVEEESEMVFLERQQAEVFRTVLGKLAWLSVSLPSLMYCTSWLSSYQSKPTESLGPL